MAQKSNKFASGKYAWGMCDVCAIRCRYADLRGTTIRGRRTGLLACPTCWDPDHPQNFLDQYVTVDAQALRNARPDTGLAASRELFPPGNWINGQPPGWERLPPEEQKQFLARYQIAIRAWEDRRARRGGQRDDVTR